MGVKAKWLSRMMFQGPYVTLCLNEKQLAEAAKDIHMDPPPPFVPNDHANAAAHFMATNTGELAVLVCFRPPGEDIDSIQVAALLMHEAVHVFQEFCRWIGEESPSDEFEAYSIQHIAQELMYAYSRQAVK